MTDSRLTLYGFPLSQNSRVAEMALVAFGVPYEFRVVNLLAGENRGEAFRALSPRGKVPILVEETSAGRRVLTESLAIARYARHRSGTEAAAPRAGSGEWIAEETAIAFLSTGFCVHEQGFVQSKVYATSFGVAPDVAERRLDVYERQLRRDLQDVEETLFRESPHFAVTNHWTIVDCLLAPRLEMIVRMGRMPLEPRWPRVHGYLESMRRSFEPFQRVHKVFLDMLGESTPSTL